MTSPSKDRIQLGGNADQCARRSWPVEIDIYPEYTGNGAFFFERADEPIWNDAQAGYQRVAELDLEENDIVWLTPSPANNTWGIAVRSDVAEENGLSTLHPVRRVGSRRRRGRSWRPPPSSSRRQPALPEIPGGLRLRAQPRTTDSCCPAATPPRPSRPRPQQTNRAPTPPWSMAPMAASPRPGLVVHGRRSGRAAGLCSRRRSSARRCSTEYPQIEELLKPVFEALTLEVLQDLNGRVQVGGEPAAAVATDFLTQNGFLGG
jgi:osmoprotectant transport system substrate-binding protein